MGGSEDIENRGQMIPSPPSPFRLPSPKTTTTKTPNKNNRDNRNIPWSIPSPFKPPSPKTTKTLRTPSRNSNHRNDRNRIECKIRQLREVTPSPDSRNTVSNHTVSEQYPFQQP